MDNCFVACGCDDLEGVTKSDLDRYTDRIENVLCEDKGRRLFRNFMFSSNFRHGRKVLDFWEKIEKLLNYRENADGTTSPTYLRDLDNVTKAAERIDELNYTTMQNFETACENKNREEINVVLKSLKLEASEALSSEYDAFRSRFVPNKFRNK